MGTPIEKLGKAEAPKLNPDKAVAGMLGDPAVAAGAAGLDAAAESPIPIKVEPSPLDAPSMGILCCGSVFKGRSVYAFIK